MRGDCCFRWGCTKSDGVSMDQVDYPLEKPDDAYQDPFLDDDFDDFFSSCIKEVRTPEGIGFELIAERKLIDVPSDIVLEALLIDDCKLPGGGDEEQVPSTSDRIHEAITPADVKRRVTVYTTLSHVDFNVPGHRPATISKLSRLKDLRLKQIRFYLDQDSEVLNNWERDCHCNNLKYVNLTHTLKSEEKRTIALLLIETEWLQAILDLIHLNKISVSTSTTEFDAEIPVGIDREGIYALSNLTGSGPKIATDILISVFSQRSDERATAKLSLALIRQADLYFTELKILETLLKLCQAARLTTNEFISFCSRMRKTSNIPECPCGTPITAISTWKSHDCKFESWMIRIGIAIRSGSYLSFLEVSWDIAISLSRD